MPEPETHEIIIIGAECLAENVTTPGAISALTNTVNTAHDIADGQVQSPETTAVAQKLEEFTNFVSETDYCARFQQFKSELDALIAAC